jgi:hypothetical protein
MLRRYIQGFFKKELHSIILWMSGTGIVGLRLNRHCFLDGTFQAAPPGFNRLIVLRSYVRSNHEYITCGFALLTGKLGGLYDELLGAVQAVMEGEWKPSYFTSDFEKAIINSIHKKLPGTTFVGCFFNFMQALTKK